MSIREVSKLLEQFTQIRLFALKFLQPLLRPAKGSLAERESRCIYVQLLARMTQQNSNRASAGALE